MEQGIACCAPSGCSSTMMPHGCRLIARGSGCAHTWLLPCVETLSWLSRMGLFVRLICAKFHACVSTVSDTAVRLIKGCGVAVVARCGIPPQPISNTRQTSSVAWRQWGMLPTPCPGDGPGVIYRPYRLLSLFGVSICTSPKARTLLAQPECVAQFSTLLGHGLA